MSCSVLACYPIPVTYGTDLQRIEAASNPHPWNNESLLDSHQRFSHLGAFVGTTLVAFVLYRVVADEAEIIHVVCDKPHQGKGYINTLLSQLKQQLRHEGIATLFLEVREDNDRAKHVYQQLGFTTVGRRKNYYGDSSGGRHDALIQRLMLSPCYSEMA